MSWPKPLNFDLTPMQLNNLYKLLGEPSPSKEVLTEIGMIVWENCVSLPTIAESE